MGRPEGARNRLDNAADPVRVEIETALRKGVPLIPVLVFGAAMPGVGELPESLADLAYRNAMQIDAGRDFDTHMARLIRAVDGHPSRQWGGAGVCHSTVTCEAIAAMLRTVATDAATAMRFARLGAGRSGRAEAARSGPGPASTDTPRGVRLRLVARRLQNTT